MVSKVFVHGNPETDVIWSLLVGELTGQGVDDIVRLSPPGFGAPVPAGWRATPANYAAWLADAIEALDAPVDVVGHDWGAGHVAGLVATRPDLVRSAAFDVAGLLHPDYEWHSAAQTWQTPDEGEAAIEFMLSMPVVERAAAYGNLGLPPEIAGPMAAGFDAEMGRCILELYRAAVQPALRELGDRLAATDRPPCLLIDATADAYVPSSLTPAVAERLGAEVLTLTDHGHWWMVSSPATAAAGLATFWAALD